MRREYKYVVLGLGGLGSGAAYWLSRRAGKDVLALEQFELGHIHGESQDHSRIIRLSYHTPSYVKLARLAYDAWNVVEQEAGEKLIVKTGGLDLWPSNPAIPMSDYTQSLSSCNIPFTLFDAAEIRRRFPQFRVSDGVIGLYQEEGGIAAAAKCTAAHQRLAREYGATLLDNTPVKSIRPKAGAFDIATQTAVYSCEKLVIAAGPWTNAALAHFGRQLPLTITQEQVTYFVPQNLSEFAPGKFPIWIWMDDPSFYGFPVYGEPAVKVGQDVGGREVTPETRTYEPNGDALQRVQKFLQEYLPSALGKILYTKSCLYTLTPDRDFVVDSLPDHPNCLVTIGAGHAFKFASVIGKILSELSMDGITSADIGSFAISREVLNTTNPPRNFLS
jgi:sarcosine oxidase